MQNVAVLCGVKRARVRLIEVFAHRLLGGCVNLAFRDAEFGQTRRQIKALHQCFGPIGQIVPVVEPNDVLQPGEPVGRDA